MILLAIITHGFKLVVLAHMIYINDKGIIENIKNLFYM